MELKDIKELIALIRKNDLSEFSLEQEGFKITLKRGFEAQPVVTTQHFAPQALPQLIHSPLSTAQAEAAPTHAPQNDTRDIQSPMVGTFYSAPSPDAPSFVSVGQQITPDSVICIIEAMKVMNEIKACLLYTSPSPRDS